MPQLENKHVKDQLQWGQNSTTSREPESDEDVQTNSEPKASLLCGIEPLAIRNTNNLWKLSDQDYQDKYYCVIIQTTYWVRVSECR